MEKAEREKKARDAEKVVDEQPTKDAEKDKTQQADKDLSKESTAKARENLAKTSVPLNPGIHWGFMIIDKTTEEATWLDGDIDTERLQEPKRTRITRMYGAARTAGKVLCGYDTVMQRTRRTFNASTLKHVPHDHKDNRFQGDRGCSCGPWVFAMFRYILKHPNLLTDQTGLKGSFTRSKLKAHKRDLRLDSREARHAMQNVIKEAVETGHPADGLPYGLTVPVMNIFDLFNRGDLLNSLFNFLGLRRANLPTARNRLPPAADDDDSNEDDDDLLGAFTEEEILKEIRDHPEDYRNMSPDEQLRQARQTLKALQAAMLEDANMKREPRPFNIAEALGKHDADFLNASPEMVAAFVGLKPIGDLLKAGQDEWHQRTILQHIFGSIDKLTPERTTQWKTKDPRFKKQKPKTHEETIEKLKDDVKLVGKRNLRGSLMHYPATYIDAITPRLQAEADAAASRLKGYPEGATALPNFVQADDTETARWIAANPELFATKAPGHNHITDRALLHTHFKKHDFRTETPEDLVKHWSFDGAVFTPEEHGTLGHEAVLARLRAHYDEIHVQTEARMAKLEADLKEKRRKAAGKPPSNKRKPTDDLNSDAASKRQKTAYEMPSDVAKTDWCLVSDAQLQPHLTRSVIGSQKIRNKRINSWTHRALLFNRYGGHFKDESDERVWQYWVHDRNVFRHRGRKKKDVDVVWTGEKVEVLVEMGEARRRLVGVYEAKEPEETESSGSDDEGFD
jgi:hypothetical protein